MPQHLSSSKNKMRQEYRKARMGLPDGQQQLAAEQLLQTCLALPEFIHSKKIAVYLANDGEINLEPLVTYCWHHNKEVHLPVLHSFSKGHLLFVKYCKNTAMKNNRFGIPEPVVTCANICPLAELDVIFTPLVAFDKQCNRLGMGGGYYDRTLAPINRDRLQTAVIGLAHQCQLVETGLAGELWDVPMQKIITPEHVFSCTG